MIKKLYTVNREWGLQMSINIKIEYLVVNSNARFDVIRSNDVTINQDNHFKYLGTKLVKEDLRDSEIKNRIQQSGRIIECLKSV